MPLLIHASNLQGSGQELQPHFTDEKPKALTGYGPATVKPDLKPAWSHGSLLSFIRQKAFAIGKPKTNLLRLRRDCLTAAGPR